MLHDKVLVIAGPTASGKSALALKLAQNLQGEIINGDSLQLYKDLTILTARPSDKDMSIVPHHLYGILESHENSSAAWWAQQTHKILLDVHSRGKIPIIVGGTGLYLKTLIKGISDIPDIDPNIRKDVRGQVQHYFGINLYHHVRALDPQIEGRMNPHDRQRLARALEVFLQTGRSIFDFHKEKDPLSEEERPFYSILLLPCRENLYAHINQRFLHMIAQGGIEEAKYIVSLNIPEESSFFKAIGLRELIHYLRDELTLEQATQLAQRNSRRYAKRQMTWFRHQFKADVLCREDELSNLSSLSTFMSL